MFGISLPANAGKPTASFGGTCTTTTDSSGNVFHQLTFSNIPGGTAYISILRQGGYITSDGIPGFVNPPALAPLLKPFNSTIPDNDQNFDLHYTLRVGETWLYKAFLTTAYGHNDSAKSAITRIDCPFN